MRRIYKNFLFLGVSIGLIMGRYCFPHEAVAVHSLAFQEGASHKDQYVNFKGRLEHLARVMKSINVHDEEQVNGCMDLIAQLVNDRVDATGRDLDSFKVFLGKAQKTFKNVIHVHEQLADALKRVEEPIPFIDRYELVQDMIDDGIITRDEQNLFISRLRVLISDLSSAKPEERNDLAFLVDDFFETIENADVEKRFIKAIAECRTHLRAEMQKYDVPFLLDEFIESIKEKMQQSFDTHEKRDFFMHSLSRLVHYPAYSREELIKVKSFFNDTIMALIDGRPDWKILKDKLVSLSEALSKRQVVDSLVISQQSAFKIPKGSLFNLVSLNTGLRGDYFVTALRNNKLKANSTNALNPEAQFDLVEHPDGTISLRNKAKNNVIQCGKKGLVLAPENDHLDQRFVIEGTVYDFVLQSCSNKKYISVAGDGSVISVSVKGTGEHFKIVLLTPYQVALSQNRLRDSLERIAGYKLQLAAQAKTIFEREMLVRDIQAFVDEKRVNKKMWKSFKEDANLIQEILSLSDFLSGKSEYHPFAGLFALIKKTVSDEKAFHEDVPKTYKARIAALNNQMKVLLKGGAHYTEKSCFLDEAQILVNDRADASVNELALLKAVLVHARAKVFMAQSEELFRTKVEELLGELHTITSFGLRMTRLKNTVEMCRISDSAHAVLAIQIHALIRDIKTFSVDETNELEVYLNEVQAKMHNDKELVHIIHEIKKLEDVLRKGRPSHA